jgi:alginate O-acetyltransferase complex protein AlgI
MLFNSFGFLCFLTTVLAVYYLLPHKQQNHFLLAASCFFYACWDWRFLAPLLVSTSIDYWCAGRMEDSIKADKGQAARYPYLVTSVVTNIGLLAVFKYFNFFAASTHDLLTAIGLHPAVSTLRIILPVGISFYTFQALSYTIDVYRGQLHASRSFPDFLLAILYFPHLVAGPIQRAHNLLPQVVNERRITSFQVKAGLTLIVWGYFKKVFVADNLAPIVNRVFDEPHPNGSHVLIAAYAFAVQIFCDFSGYTDIARGIAKLMGFEFVLNFNFPYLARNPKEFWSRWHISLSSWLRDYLYVPLGGNRKGEFQTYRNLMLTMIIGGLWHGAAWTFVLWGLYHGCLLVGHRIFETYFRRDVAAEPDPRLKPSHWLAVLVFFQFTCFGWLIFRAGSVAQLSDMTAALSHPLQNFDTALAGQVLLTVFPLLLAQLIRSIAALLPALRTGWQWPEVRAVAYGLLLYLVLFRGGRPESFIYFQF